MAISVTEKAEKKYRNKIADYLSSDDYNVVELHVESNEGYEEFLADKEFMTKFAGLDLENQTNVYPELVQITITLVNKELTGFSDRANILSSNGDIT